jgi:hypothetical protein
VRRHKPLLEAALHRRANDDRCRRDEEVGAVMVVVTVMVVMMEAARGRGGRCKRRSRDDRSGGEAEGKFADHCLNSKDGALNADVVSHANWSGRRRTAFRRNVTLRTAPAIEAQAKSPAAMRAGALP